MEQYVGKSDYEKTREDALSFKAGDRFHVASKADAKWWSVYAVSTGDRGYVPSELLEQYIDTTAGKVAEELSKSKFGDCKRVTLTELKSRIAPAPVAAGPDDASPQDSPELTIIKPLSEVTQLPEDCQQVHPKKLTNPHLESKLHVKLNKEIKLNNALGGAQNLGKPELEKVMQRRKPDAEGRVGPIRPEKSIPKPAATDELAEQLSKRTQKLEDAEKQAEREAEIENQKPEFMKVSLKKTKATSS
ncbi:hypothetical protein EMCRGX_G026454 [Ephydatia muelleri]